MITHFICKHCGRRVPLAPGFCIMCGSGDEAEISVKLKDITILSTKPTSPVVPMKRPVLQKPLLVRVGERR